MIDDSVTEKLFSLAQKFADAKDATVSKQLLKRICAILRKNVAPKSDDVNILEETQLADFAKSNLEVFVKITNAVTSSIDNLKLKLPALNQCLVFGDVREVVLRAVGDICAQPASQETVECLFQVLKYSTSMKISKSLCEYDGVAKTCELFTNRLTRLLTDAWRGFLKLRMPPQTLKKVLTFLPDNVMPRVRQPILMTDFLMKSFQIGDPFNVLSLRGMFVLMTKYNLDYPDFYGKLYSLVQPTIFYAPHRQQFFELLDFFLSSTHLPIYVVSAFVKRLARLSLIAPPDCCLAMLTLIHLWLKRHSRLACMLKVLKQGPDFHDLYDFDEMSLPNTKATESVLWEIATLKSHYYPKVAQNAAAVLGCDSRLDGEKIICEDVYDRPIRKVNDINMNFKSKSLLQSVSLNGTDYFE